MSLFIMIESTKAKAFFKFLKIFCVLFLLNQNAMASGRCHRFLNNESSRVNINRTQFEGLDFKNFFEDGFRSSKFYDYFEGDVNAVRTILKWWYKDITWGFDSKFNSAFKVLGQKNISLILDPGIFLRLNKFLSFAKKHPNFSGIELRQAFSDYLGFITLYRGLTFSPERIDNYKKRGFPSYFFDPNKNTYEPSNKNHSIALEFFRAGPVSDVKQRVYGGSGRSSFHSLSQSYSTSKLLARAFAFVDKESEYRGEKGYLIEIRIPRLEFVQIKDFSLVAKLIEKTTFYKADGHLVYAGFDGLEALVFGRVEKEWITSLTQADSEKGLQKVIMILPPMMSSY